MDERKIDDISFVAGRWPFDETRPTIIFIHAAGMNHLLWQFQMEGLSDYMNTVAIDLPGHGNSDGTGKNRIEAYAEIVSAFIKKLNAPKPVVCGLSMGGAIVQSLLLSDPAMYHGAVIVNSGARLRVAPVIFELIDKDYPSFIGSLSSVPSSANTSPTKRDAIMKNLSGCTAETTKGDFEACDQFDIMGHIGKIKTPVLVLTAGNDLVTPLKYGAYLHQNIKGSELATIEGAGHLSPVEKPEDVTQAIKNFIDAIHQ